MVVAQIKALKISPWQSTLCYTCSGMYCVGSSTWLSSRIRIHIPRLPPISLSGDHRPLLQFKPSELRQDLMDVVGFHLGLSPPGVDSSFVPSRSSLTGSSCNLMRFTSAQVTFHIAGRCPSGRPPSRPGKAVECAAICTLDP